MGLSFSLGQPYGYVDPHKQWYSPLECDWGNIPYQNSVWQLKNSEFVSSQLKKFTNNDLSMLAELIVKEMEARGYGNKKN